MLTTATSPTALLPLLGKAASQPISRRAGAEVATTYPPMATKAICMVNVIRLQKPFPNATLTAAGEAPLSERSNRDHDHSDGDENKCVGKPALGPRREADCDPHQYAFSLYRLA